MFGRFGRLERVILPPTKTMALVSLLFSFMTPFPWVGKEDGFFIFLFID
jgi:hypothetical protein